MRTILVLAITLAFCNCDPTPDEVQKVFTDSKLVPDIMSKPPKEFLKVKIFTCEGRQCTIEFFSFTDVILVGIVSKRCCRWFGRNFNTNTNEREATSNVASGKRGILHISKD